MVVTGMNLAEVRSLAEQLDAGATQLRVVVSTVDGRVHSTTWVGPNADRFRQWWPGHRQLVLQVADKIHGLAQSAKNNANAQEQTSRGAPNAVERALYGASDLLLGVTGSAAWFAAKTALKVLKIPTGYAANPKSLKTWAGLFARKSTTLPGFVQQQARKLTPVIRRLEKTPFLALRNSPVAAALREPGKAKSLFSSANKFVVKPLGKVFKFGGIATEGANAVQAWKQGDRAGALLGGVDTVAAGLKAQPFVPLRFVGYGADALTDIADIARGKTEPKSWRPWTLL